MFFQFPFPGVIENAVFFQFPVPGVIENAVFSPSFSSACMKSCVFPVPFPVPFAVPFADSLCFSKESALHFFKTRRRMARERRGAGSFLVSTERQFEKRYNMKDVL